MHDCVCAAACLEAADQMDVAAGELLGKRWGGAENSGNSQRSRGSKESDQSRHQGISLSRM